MEELIFCFIDESESKQRKSDYYLILLGVIIPQEYLFTASKEIEKLKNKFKIKNLKDIRTLGSFTKNAKIKITRNLVDLLTQYNSKVIGIIEIPNKLRNNSYQYKRNSLYYDAIRLLSERVTLYAKRNKRKWLFIADSLDYKPTLFKELKKNISSKVRLEGETFKTKISDYLFETPFFVEDELSNFIQIADLIASSLNSGLRNYLRKNNYPIKVSDLKNYCGYLTQYWPLFDRSSKDEVKGYGIKIWWYNE